MPYDPNKGYKPIRFPTKLLIAIEALANQAKHFNFSETVRSLAEDGIEYRELKEDVKSGLAIVLRGTALGQYRRDKLSLERAQIYFEEENLTDKFASWWVSEDPALALDSARRMRGNGMRDSLADAIEEAARRVR